jgi:hypothetical protein
MSPGEDVVNSLPVRLTSDPELEVLGSVVRSVTVDMVDVLTREQLAPESFLHDVTMLEDPTAIVETDHPVPAGVNAPSVVAALPSPARCSLALSGFDRSPPACLDQMTGCS